MRAITPPLWVAAVSTVVVGSTVAAVTAPMATYGLTLATFGMVHVLVELRYVDRRFSDRIPRNLTTGWLLVLAAIVVVRLLTIATPIDRALAGALELGLVGVLALAVLPILRTAPPGRSALVIASAALLLWGAFSAPLPTLVVLAVLHNVTPVGFLAERLRGRERRAAMLFCAVAFVGVPLLIASGLVADALANAGMTTWEPFASGGLRDNLGVFVPARWADGPRAIDLFSAAVYLQCLHYAVVIGVLPRLEPRDPVSGSAWVRWPSRRTWLPVLAGVAAVSLCAYTASFRDARAVYGLFALVHAWIEIPILLAALTPLPETVE